MYSLLIPLVQEVEQSKAYKIGYELGYFVGSNFWTFITVVVILLAAIVYFAFFKRKKKDNWR